MAIFDHRSERDDLYLARISHEHRSTGRQWSVLLIVSLLVSFVGLTLFLDLAGYTKIVL